MRMYACAFPGCYATVEEPRSFCKRHEKAGERMKAQRVADAPAQKWQGADRPNESLYHTTRWRKLRAETIKRNPSCARCGTTQYLTVHHFIQPKGDKESFYSADNLVVLCKQCHDRMTSAENKK